MRVRPTSLTPYDISPYGQEKETISVSVNKRSGSVTTGDWFGFYKASEKNNRKYLQSQYITKENVDAKNFMITFKAPRTPGDYVIRFFPSRYVSYTYNTTTYKTHTTQRQLSFPLISSCKYTHVASSNFVRIYNRNKISVSPYSLEQSRIKDLMVTFCITSVDFSNWDYVAVYAVGKNNNDYVSHHYIKPPNKTITIPAPLQEGKYEVPSFDLGGDCTILMAL